MSPLWLVPVAVVVLGLPFVVLALRQLADDARRLGEEVRRVGELQPALLRVRDERELALERLRTLRRR